MSTQPTSSSRKVAVPARVHCENGSPAEITLRLTPFDQKEYRRLIEARGETIRRVVNGLNPLLRLRTALDAGCGVGFFSQLLRECGLEVGGFDGRAANIEEARRRFPYIPFEVADIESANVREFGEFDLVLCFGLLYHLENPLKAIRHLRAITRKCLLLESMVVPDREAELLLRDEPQQEDQSLTQTACCASEAALVKMLHRAGFALVYRVTPLPDHDDFRDTNEHKRRRTVLVACDIPLDVAGFRLMPEPDSSKDPWAKTERRSGALARVQHFWSSSRRRKYLTIAFRLRRLFPEMPIPLRLPFGAWWLAQESALDQALMYGDFEPAEMRFVDRFVRPGMTVVDAGAHHGLYTLLASKRVGREGRVVAIEPSGRECSRLRRHLRVNRCSNVALEECALGEREGWSDLHLVEGEHDWCNSLQSPNVTAETHAQRVCVRRLDTLLQELAIPRIDFLKLDVEGAELSALKGMGKLLAENPRPVILAEVQDLRTAAWRYAAREILVFLQERGFDWFALMTDGRLTPVMPESQEYDGNFVAIPEERLPECAELLA